MYFSTIVGHIFDGLGRAEIECDPSSDQLGRSPNVFQGELGYKMTESV